MDTIDLSPLLEQLDDNIDDLEDTLELLLKAPLTETAAKLPLLDRAKLNVSITYAIESILFSYLRLNGVNAKGHPVFRELTRLKQYFEKIKIAESGEVKRDNLTLDKSAAGRIIKHALAGNDKYDLQRAEQMAKEKARAHMRFEQVSKKRKVDDRDEGPPTSTKSSSSGSSSSSSSESESENAVPEPVEAEAATAEMPETDRPPKKKRNRMEKRRRDEIQTAKAAGVEVGAAGVAEISQKKPQSKRRRRREQQQPTQDGADAAEEETILPSKTSQPPLGHSAAFQALLKGPLPKPDKGKHKPKRREGKGARRAAEGESKEP